MVIVWRWICFDISPREMRMRMNRIVSVTGADAGESESPSIPGPNKVIIINEVDLTALEKYEES